MITEIIAIDAITDDLLKAMGHQEDSLKQATSQATQFFGGNHHRAQL